MNVQMYEVFHFPFLILSYKDTHKRAQYKIKEDLFLLSSESIFGAAKDTHKRAQYKINMSLFLLSRESTFGEAKDNENNREQKI